MNDDDLYKLTDYVEELDSGDIIAIYIRWHVDPIQARRVISSFAIEEGFCDSDDIEQFGDPTHERWRKIPHPEHGSIFKRGAGRGSFPVTVMSMREWVR